MLITSITFPEPGALTKVAAVVLSVNKAALLICTFETNVSTPNNPLCPYGKNQRECEQLRGHEVNVWGGEGASEGSCWMQFLNFI